MTVDAWLREMLAIIAEYVEEVRRRARAVDYALLRREEGNLQWLLRIARDVDQGTIGNGQGRIRIAGRDTRAARILALPAR